MILISLKSISYNLILLVSGLIIGTKLSAFVYAIIFACVYTVLTFLFGEWIFTGSRIKPLPLAGLLVAGYAMDALISISFFSWYQSRNLFLEQTALSHLLFGGLYLISMMGAYILKKRMAALNGGLAEGLA